MVRTFLKIYMELGSFFLFLQEQIKDIIIPHRAFHPTDHVQQDIHPTDNPPPSARKSGAGKTRRRVRRRRGRLPSSARQNLRTLVMQSSQCTFLQMTYTAENPHADGSAAPGARPRFRPPLKRHPTPRLPHPRQQDGGKIDVLSSANGPSTVALQQRCLYRTSASARSPS
jgi:hypothetical protein